MKFIYLDLGLYRATEMIWMVESILPDLGITDYEAHGFEACRSYALDAEDYFRKNEKVHIHHIAIGGFNGGGKLYYAKNKLGHSIFSSKNNVSKSKFEVIVVRKFSTWVERQGIDLENSIVMMKVNIEGAEYVFFQDLIASGLRKHVDIISGAIDDVKKIKGYADQIEDYYKMLRDNSITCIPFTEYKPQTKETMKDILWQKLAQTVQQ